MEYFTKNTFFHEENEKEEKKKLMFNYNKNEEDKTDEHLTIEENKDKKNETLIFPNNNKTFFPYTNEVSFI